MFNKLINGGLSQAEYGVAVSLYGVQPGDNNGKIFVQYFLTFLFLVLVPVILFFGVLAFAKKKQFSKKERIWTVTIVLGIYFAILVGVVLSVVYIIR